MDVTRTTAAVQRYLDRLRADPEPVDASEVVRELLGRSADRLQILCTAMLRRSYRRLARAPVGLTGEELLGAVVARLIKALRATQPSGVREFFALANVHIRWELNELARRLDEHTPPGELEEPLALDQSSRERGGSVSARRIFGALDDLGEDTREAFCLVRFQGLTHDEAAEILGVSTKTIQRRLNQSRMQLATLLEDLRPLDGVAGSANHDRQDPTRNGAR